MSVSVFHALLWKNLLLRRNHWCQTLAEVLIPLSLLLLVNLYVPKIKFPYSNHNYNELQGNEDYQYQDAVLLYYPSNNFTDPLMAQVGKNLGYKRLNVKAKNITTASQFKFGLEFENRELDYTIYPRNDFLRNSLPVWNDESLLISGKFIHTATSILAKIQHAVASPFIASESKKIVPKVMLRNVDSFNREISPYAVLAITAVFFAYCFLVPPVITRIVEEKRSGAKELMRMMGVSSEWLWLTKFIDSMMVVTAVVTGFVILLYLPLRETSSFVVHVNPFVFWTLLIVGMIAVIVSLFFLSCWFTSPTLAATFAQTIGIASIVILGVMEVAAFAWWKRMLCCLLPHMTLVYTTQILLTFDAYGKDVKWSERLSLSENSLTLSDVLLMIILDIFLYAILTWYCDKVVPANYGVTKPLDFFLKKSYWSNKAKVTADTVPLKGGVEPLSNAGIFIHQLRKIYRSSGSHPVVAVDCVNMEAPVGRITALLGHNGAGKTTTMHVITGLIPATAGTVVINGHDIRTDLKAARQSLGLCPQQDLLFRDLTTLQTLIFFGMIKGLSHTAASAEADKLLEVLKLSHAKHKQTQNLSGGMKRKLSLGIAIIGGSKVLILDEPTAGVDPELRREICDLLLSFRGKRTILLTTHIMEEADAISDFIFIMDHGKVQCSGTPMDLKTQFGTGYTLQVVVKDKDEVPVMDLVKSTVNNSRLKSHNGAILTFQLPGIQTCTFSVLFEQLDDLQAAGNVESYSVSISTLEDVFVRVREIEVERTLGTETDEVDLSPYRHLESNAELSVSKFSGLHLLLRQTFALLYKKFLCFVRGYWHYAIYSCFPLLLMAKAAFNGSFAQTETANGDLVFFNYTDALYPGMEIMISRATECTSCRLFEGAFKALAEERGFHVTEVLNISEAVNDLFKRDFHQYSRYLALTLDLTDNEIRLQYNNHAVHIMSVGLNIIHNALLGASRVLTAVNLTLVPEPLELANPAPRDYESSLPDLIGVQTLFYMNTLIVEKLRGAKAMQLLAVPAAVYWLAHLMFDVFTFIPYGILTSSIYYYSVPDDIIFHAPYTNGGDFPMALILWGACMILISYVITCFTKTKTGAISIALLLYFTFDFFIWPFITIEVVPEWVGYLHPTSIWKLGLKNKIGYMCLLHLLVYAVILFNCLVLIESTIPRRIIHSMLSCMCSVQYKSDDKTDTAVVKETQTVKEMMRAPDRAFDTLLVSGLKRWYGLLRPKPAVRGVSFHVPPSACFGLLGVNGAGKSSTFNMLTSQISCSAGDAVLNDSHLAEWRPNKYLSQVSYCPQSSGIIPQLKGKEFLQLFARLRGYKEPQVVETVKHWIKILDLEDCAERPCGKYSGGMERKLSAAAAFLWDAAIVMLDEPTSGVDPVARRSIWKAVSSAQESGKGVVLTSHSMDECEALCSRLAIMVDGSFRCIGETSTLKKKFGGGFSVQLKVAAGNMEDMCNFQAAVVAALGPGCRLTDRHCSILHYHILDENTQWKTLFSNLEKLKQRFPLLESYIASETTLEEIFLAFAGHRQAPSEHVQCLDLL